MANIASQRKRINRSARERLENRRLRSSVKTHFRRVERAVESGESETVTDEHRKLVSQIDKAVQRGALHSNNGARKKTRAARLLTGASQ
jgi:small subunit ribosomal protein S20